MALSVVLIFMVLYLSNASGYYVSIEVVYYFIEILNNVITFITQKYPQVSLPRNNRISRLFIFKDVVKKSAAGTVDIQFMPADKVVSAKIGDPLLDVAKKAGVEIPTKCMKGECGTCEVNINGKWVKSCQETGTFCL